MWCDDSIWTNLFQQERDCFLHSMQKNCLCRKNWAKIHNAQLGRMINKHLFCHFLGYVYSNHVKLGIGPTAVNGKKWKLFMYRQAVHNKENPVMRFLVQVVGA